METATILNGTRYYVMAVTPTRLYSFTGIGLLDVSLTLTPIFCCWSHGNWVTNNYVVKLSDVFSSKSRPVSRTDLMANISW